MEREDADAREAARDQARADAWRTREIGAFYDDAFRSFGVETPPPVDGERPARYRRRLFDRLRVKLPSGHSLADCRSDDLPAGQAFVNIEELLLRAAKAEGEKPSTENLPDDGTIVARTRVDDMGQKSTEFFGHELYIKAMGRPGRRVLRLMN